MEIMKNKILTSVLNFTYKKLNLVIIERNKLKNWASFSPSQTESTIHTAQAYSQGQPDGENRLDEILGS